MNKIQCAVIGVGYLGKFHAQKYADLSAAQLVAVCDTDKAACDAIAAQHQTTACYNYHQLLGKVDAVSIAVPTVHHFAIARDFLAHGAHVLVEKPITKTLAEAEQLVQLAKQKQRILQVGHLERFNAARLALDEYLEHPLFIESQRLSPFKPRNTDVNVILDLMIHDIDLIQSLLPDASVEHIEAQGAPVLTQNIDIANARLNFSNHCVTNVTASRISFKTERSMRIFQHKSYISIDFQQQKFAVFEKGEGELFAGIPEIIRHESVFEKNDALQLEIIDFLQAIRDNTQPLVTGEDGYKALHTAEQITQTITKRWEQVSSEIA